MDDQHLFNFPGKAKSAVWIHFGFKESSPGTLDMSRVFCKICQKGYSYNGNTTNLAMHLKRDHGDLNEPSRSKQPKIVSSFSTSQSQILPKNRITQIHEAIGGFVTHSLQPLNVIEHKDFRNLLHVLEPRYQPPCAKTIVGILKKKYKILRDDIHSEVIGRPVVITHDSWTSMNTESYDTVTCSYITNQWDLKCRVLDTLKIEGYHTSENIARVLTAVKQNWGLGDIVAVTDSASNEVKAFSLLKWERHSCMSHNINLVVTCGLKEVSRLVAKGRSLVTYFHHSSVATGLLHDKQKLLLSKEAQDHKLLGDCCTRWNSTYDMLHRISEQTAALHVVATDPTFKYADVLKSKLYSYSEQNLVEMILLTLEATVMLSSESKPTCAMVVPILIKLSKVLEIYDGDSNLISKMKKAMTDNLEKRQKSKPTYLLASALDPRTKKLLFLPASEKDEVFSDLKMKCTEVIAASDSEDKVKTEPLNTIPENPETPSLPSLLLSENESTSDPSVLPSLPVPELETKHEIEGETMVIKSELSEDSANDESDSPMPKRAKQNWLDDIIFVAEEAPTLSKNEIICKEVENYCREPQIEQDENPLLWWESREVIYPTVARVAKKFLAIPASSVPSERIFSLAGNLVSKKRSQPSCENVNLLIFLNKSSK